MFVGRAIVEKALEKGWDVAVLTRGHHPLPAFSRPVTHHRGDRRTELENLAGAWDAVIDTCGYRPEDVAGAVTALRSRAHRYVFISSASVYPDEIKVGEECVDLAAPVDPDAMDPGRRHDYGPLKLACEQAVRAGFGNRSLVLRPALVVGPHDPSERFGYWPQRMFIGGDVLAPGHPSDIVQLIDARDHAAFAVRCVESDTVGTFNIASEPQSLYGVLKACTPPGTEVRVHWVDGKLLRLNRVEPWTELPLWWGPGRAPMIATTRASAAGLTIRPLSATAEDTLAWERTRADPFPRKSQLTRAREREIIARYS